ncbi:hypothetical protein [Spongorhabdus nitratireducens]
MKFFFKKIFKTEVIVFFVLFFSSGNSLAKLFNTDVKLETQVAVFCNMNQGAELHFKKEGSFTLFTETPRIIYEQKKGVNSFHIPPDETCTLLRIRTIPGLPPLADSKERNSFLVKYGELQFEYDVRSKSVTLIVDGLNESEDCILRLKGKYLPDEEFLLLDGDDELTVESSSDSFYCDLPLRNGTLTLTIQGGCFCPDRWLVKSSQEPSFQPVFSHDEETCASIDFSIMSVVPASLCSAETGPPLMCSTPLQVVIKGINFRHQNVLQLNTCQFGVKEFYKDIYEWWSCTIEEQGGAQCFDQYFYHSWEMTLEAHITGENGCFVLLMPEGEKTVFPRSGFCPGPLPVGVCPSSVEKVGRVSTVSTSSVKKFEHHSSLRRADKKERGGVEVGKAYFTVEMNGEEIQLQPEHYMLLRSSFPSLNKVILEPEYPIKLLNTGSQRQFYMVCPDTCEVRDVKAIKECDELFKTGWVYVGYNLFGDACRNNMVLDGGEGLVPVYSQAVGDRYKDLAERDRSLVEQLKSQNMEPVSWYLISQLAHQEKLGIIAHNLKNALFYKYYEGLPFAVSDNVNDKGSLRVKAVSDSQTPMYEVSTSVAFKSVQVERKWAKELRIDVTGKNSAGDFIKLPASCVLDSCCLVKKSGRGYAVVGFNIGFRITCDKFRDALEISRGGKVSIPKQKVKRISKELISTPTEMTWAVRSPSVRRIFAQDPETAASLVTSTAHMGFKKGGGGPVKVEASKSKSRYQFRADNPFVRSGSSPDSLLVDFETCRAALKYVLALRLRSALMVDEHIRLSRVAPQLFAVPFVTTFGFSCDCSGHATEICRKVAGGFKNGLNDYEQCLNFMDQALNYSEQVLVQSDDLNQTYQRFLTGVANYRPTTVWLDHSRSEVARVVSELLIECNVGLRPIQSVIVAVFISGCNSIATIEPGFKKLKNKYYKDIQKSVWELWKKSSTGIEYFVLENTNRLFSLNSSKSFDNGSAKKRLAAVLECALTAVKEEKQCLEIMEAMLFDFCCLIPFEHPDKSSTAHSSMQSVDILNEEDVGASSPVLTLGPPVLSVTSEAGSHTSGYHSYSGSEPAAVSREVNSQHLATGRLYTRSISATTSPSQLLSSHWSTSAPLGQTGFGLQGVSTELDIRRMSDTHSGSESNGSRTGFMGSLTDNRLVRGIKELKQRWKSRNQLSSGSSPESVSKARRLHTTYSRSASNLTHLRIDTGTGGAIGEVESSEIWDGDRTKSLEDMLSEHLKRGYSDQDESSSEEEEEEKGIQGSHHHSRGSLSSIGGGYTTSSKWIFSDTSEDRAIRRRPGRSHSLGQEQLFTTLIGAGVSDYVGELEPETKSVVGTKVVGQIVTTSMGPRWPRQSVSTGHSRESSYSSAGSSDELGRSKSGGYGTNIKRGGNYRQHNHTHSKLHQRRVKSSSAMRLDSSTTSGPIHPLPIRLDMIKGSPHTAVDGSFPFPDSQQEDRDGGLGKLYRHLECMMLGNDFESFKTIMENIIRNHFAGNTAQLVSHLSRLDPSRYSYIDVSKKNNVLIKLSRDTLSTYRTSIQELITILNSITHGKAIYYFNSVLGEEL